MSVAPNFLDVPPLDQRDRIPDTVIHALVQHIAEKFDPDKIILFGSHAYGEPKPWSDVDLLVVMDVPREEEMKVALAIQHSLPPHWFSIDILVRSQATLDKRIALNDWFLQDITRSGKTMYERIDRRVG